MQFMDGTSVWLLAGFIFLLRIVDVSLGTMRTIAVVGGRVRISVLLGFLEVLVWVIAISQVILQIREHPLLMVAYAAGFASGNAVGIYLEKTLALGQCVLRVITKHGGAVADVVRSHGRVLATFRSELEDEVTLLLFVVLPRRELAAMLQKARKVDPQLFWIVERFSETSHLAPLPHATGWRAVFKRK